MHAVKPQATVTAAFAGSFQDPVKGYEIASQMFLGGIDYIQTDSAATDRGIIQAANEKPGRMVSALDPAQYLLGPASVVAVVSPDFGQSLHRQAGAALAFDWQGGRHVQTGLGTGVIDFLLSPVYQEQGSMEIVARSAETWPHIETARAGIFNWLGCGAVQPDDMIAPPATEASCSPIARGWSIARTVTISAGGSLHGTGAAIPDWCRSESAHRAVMFGAENLPKTRFHGQDMKTIVYLLRVSTPRHDAGQQDHAECNSREARYSSEAYLERRRPTPLPSRSSRPKANARHRRGTGR